MSKCTNWSKCIHHFCILYIIIDFLNRKFLVIQPQFTFLSTAYLSPCLRHIAIRKEEKIRWKYFYLKNWIDDILHPHAFKHRSSSWICGMTNRLIWHCLTDNQFRIPRILFDCRTWRFFECFQTCSHFASNESGFSLYFICVKKL